MQHAHTHTHTHTHTDMKTNTTSNTNIRAAAYETMARYKKISLKTVKYPVTKRRKPSWKQNQQNTMYTNNVPRISPQSTQKGLKSTQNDFQNGPQMVLFGTHGTPWTPRRNRVNKVAPKWCAKRPQRDPFGTTNRPLGTKKAQNIAKSMTLKRIL